MVTICKLTSFLLALLPLLAAQPARFGLPACAAPNHELADRSFFLLCHNSATKLPVWTVYELLPTHLHGAAPRPGRFRTDSALARPGAHDRDYRHSGFSRGHLVPAADLAWSPVAIHASFLLSNTAPQPQAVNAGSWRRLENAVRRLAARADAVYVATGTLVASSPPTFIGPGRVAVPTHLYKAILVVRGDQKVAYAAIVPNIDQGRRQLDSFTVSVDEVERVTGLDFFSGLEDSEEHRIESVRQPLPAAGRERASGQD